MKRHITELEKKLIGLGFTLGYKTYTGKHSQITREYVYIGHFDGIEVVVHLNKKRTEMRDYCIENFLPQFICKIDLNEITKVYDALHDLLFGENNE